MASNAENVSIWWRHHEQTTFSHMEYILYGGFGIHNVNNYVEFCDKHMELFLGRWILYFLK